MGLDMYAYKIRADLVGDEQVDVDVQRRAMQAVGFSSETITDEEFSKKSNKERQSYWEERDKAECRAKGEGLIDTDFAYWRKFNHLHGWMERLYREKGGVSEDFNCDTVRLMPEDLDRLESMAKSKALTPTAGFFFGSGEPFDDDDKEEVLSFITRAREAIEQGYAVFYSSWW